MAQCPKCGAELEQAGDRFCSKCGATITAAEAGRGDAPAAGAGLAESATVSRAAGGVAAPSASAPAGAEDGPAHDVNAPAAASIRLQINANRLLMRGSVSVLEFRVLNNGEQPVVAASLELVGNYLGQIGLKQADEPIEPGATWRDAVEFKPSEPGNHQVRVALTCRKPAAGRPAGLPEVYRGQMLLKVLDRPQAAGNIVFNRNIQAGEGAKIGFGMSIQEGGQGGADSRALGEVLGRWDVNGLIMNDAPEQWQDIPLRRPGGVLVIPPPGVMLDRAALLLPDGAIPRRVLLISLPAVTFGRKSGSNGGTGRQAASGTLSAGGGGGGGGGGDGSQVVLRLVPNAKPRSPQDDSPQARNYRQSAQISGSHFRIELRPDGLFIVDLGSVNGTMLDGQPVGRNPSGAMPATAVPSQACGPGPGVPIPLDRPSLVEVGGALRLRLVPFLDDGTLPADRLAGATGASPSLAGPGEMWDLAGRLRLRSLLVQRVNNLAEAESYLLVYRWARMGPSVSRGCPPVPGPGGDNEIILPACPEGACLRVVRLGGAGTTAGQFWMESLAGADSAGSRECLAVDGTPMRQGQFWPLKPGARLGCGQCSVQFQQFAQQFG